MLLAFIGNEWSHLLYPGHLSMAKREAATWAEAINKKLEGSGNCIMFVDGTEQQCCRPVIHQKRLYGGHKRYHSIGWQGVTGPTGIIVQLFGPCIGTYNDNRKIGESRLLDVLKKDFPGYFIYGDQGYGLSPQIQRGFPRTGATDEEKLYNRLWSAQRICVEWSFNEPVTLFPTLDFKRMKKPLHSPIGTWYLVGALFANCHTCMNGTNEISQHFDIRPPSLDEYLVPNGPDFEYWFEKYPPYWENVFPKVDLTGGRGKVK